MSEHEASTVPPDFLAIGHVTKDMLPDGHTIGGAVTYSAVTALRLGRAPAVVTSMAKDLDVRDSLSGVHVHAVPASDSTEFANAYKGGRRRQLINGTAEPLSAADILPEWRYVPLVLLCPLVREVGYDLAQHFTGSIVMASVQGWLRKWDDEGFVSPAHWDGSNVLPHVNAAICSVEDLADQGLVDQWKEMVPVLIVTMGKEGARLHCEGEWHHIEPFQARELDPTGAGDVFGAAYLIRYSETSDVLESARFASCVASFCVESQGTTGIPTKAQVSERLGTSATGTGISRKGE